jgi:hypothetical protein
VDSLRTCQRELERELSEVRERLAAMEQSMSTTPREDR